MKSTSAVAGEEAMRLPMGKSSDVRFESQPTPDVKIVLRECRSGELKVWQAAVAEGWNFRESRFSGCDDGSGSRCVGWIDEVRADSAREQIWGFP